MAICVFSEEWIWLKGVKHHVERIQELQNSNTITHNLLRDSPSIPQMPYFLILHNSFLLSRSRVNPKRISTPSGSDSVWNQMTEFCKDSFAFASSAFLAWDIWTSVAILQYRVHQLHGSHDQLHVWMLLCREINAFKSTTSSLCLLHPLRLYPSDVLPGEFSVTTLGES